jgi:hypothetical protein
MMETYTKAEDLLRISKSNKAMEVLATLPANQRTTILEGLVAAMQLSGNNLSDITKRNVSFGGWWEVTTEE